MFEKAFGKEDRGILQHSEMFILFSKVAPGDRMPHCGLVPIASSTLKG